MPSFEPAGQQDDARLTAASPAAARLLPHVVRDVPAAVLLVDVDTSEVIYASHVASQLSPTSRLPFTLGTWAVAAGMCDTAGRPLDPDSEQLRELADGVTPGGHVMTARGQTDMSTRREMLWATGVPLHDAPGLSALALVVFLPLRNVEAIETATSAAESESIVRDRAVLATGLSFTVADARLPDQPLIWVNPAFTAATGYSYEESVGKNCRFLQGPRTDPQAHLTLRAAINAGEDVVLTLLNYRKDGTPFWNSLAMNPIRDAAGELTHYVGIQTDVTEQRQVEAEREQALAAEREARQAAEEARGAAEEARHAAEEARAVAERATAEAQESRVRLQLLAEASTTLASTLDLDDTLVRLMRLVLPRLADWVLVEILGEEAGLEKRVIVEHRDGRRELCDRMAELHSAGGMTPMALTKQVLDTGRPALRSLYSEEADLGSAVSDSEMRDVVRQLGLHSALSVPLRARTRMLGVMTFCSGESGREYDEEDVRLVADLGRRAAVTLDNARLYSIEHATAETLQRSLLPDLPIVPGVEAAARYLAGHTTAAVGGDFYELLALPDGAIGVAIGDVVGHDMTAAAAMGHLRGLLRACAWDTAADDGGAPGKVMGRVDRLVQGLHVAPLATVVYARLERLAADVGDGESWQLRWSNAGHPPPMILRPDGSVTVLDTDVDLLLGVDDSARATVITPIQRGSILFCYTDGLIERRGVDLDTGIAWLAGVLAAAPAGVSPTELCDLALTGLTSVEDDIAILAVRIR